MSTTLQSIVDEFSDEDRKLIERKANVLAEEMIQQVNTPTEAGAAPATLRDPL